MTRLAFGLVALGAWSAAAAAAPSDYPTETIADYVFACMATNGQTREALQRCSCSIDVIASILPYERYVEAETTLSMSQVTGDNAAVFREVPWMQEAIADLKRAQAEAEVRCF
jgi:hypothetical protein